MSIVRLYHGSYCQIRKINLKRCNDYKDFGTGFYLTPDFGRAVTMANRSVALNGGNPEVNPFLFNKTSCQMDLRIKEFKPGSWDWARFVMMNRDRTKIPPYRHDYDIVIGPVADSRVDPEIEAYKKEFGAAYLEPDNLRELASRLRYPGGYTQYCFCTDKALQQLIND